MRLSPERLARASAQRPWLTVLLWVVSLIIAFGLVGSLLDKALTSQFVFTNTPESQRGLDLIEVLRGEPRSTNEAIIVRSEGQDVDSEAFQDVLRGLQDELEALQPDVIRPGTLSSYHRDGNEGLVSQDRRTTIITFTMAGDFDDASENIHKVINRVDEAEVPADFQLLITGQATVGEDFNELSQEGIERGESIGLPVALLILVLVFGAVVAALVPIALALGSIILALGAAAVVGQTFALSFFVTNIIFMIGLAVGIDYSLLIVARYREERSQGREKQEAIARAGGTAGRAVLFSGMTVILALIGMILVPFNIYISLGLGAIFVVIAAVLAALTLLPAVLGLLGDRVDRLSLPFVRRAQERFDETQPGGFWDKVSHTVMARPVVSLLLAGGILVAALIPAFALKTGFAGISTLPDHVRSKQGFDILDSQFSAGNVTPVQIVLDGDISSASVQAGIAALQARMAADSEGAFGPPLPLEVSSDNSVALLSAPLAGDPSGDLAEDAVQRLRRQYIPEAFGDEVDAKVYVTGDTAYNLDFFNTANNAMLVVFPFVLGMSFILLMLAFRSIVVPLKAVLLNLLSVGATYGILVLTFQEGVGQDLGIVRQFDIIEAWIPLFLFSILFGLSMDYHVFLLSRIRERFDETGDNTNAVAFGIRSTGRLITGAALIMVVVFWGFAAGDLVGLQQVGFGLGIAILLDATIVRMVLVPASMKLLGKWNWYMPSALGWLPDLRVEPARPVRTD
jgi:RND superfamily putative drug exporter